MRILVSGSRSWDRPDVIWSCLEILADEATNAGEEELVIVHGACFPTRRGEDGRFPRQSADYLADLWTRRDDHPLPVRVERHPARWSEHGKRAGVLRNDEMVRAGADVVLAFLRDDSPGTTHCIEAAERAGLIVQVVLYEDLPAEVAR